jgi:hypothetical protein
MGGTVMHVAESSARCWAGEVTYGWVDALTSAQLSRTLSLVVV